ncbi:MAG: T9SS type A sorting domain-containing protein, partial [Winogradskyella sp.]|uniref:T9SS type A sorting domain-containing protein n=1 Tax=Winogradskyella sp. TaxID=1883156 RepID=UPI00385BEEA3
GGGVNGGNVDGFGIHVRNGDTGNIFRGCRAWLNSDDGFDAINSGEPALFENCWAFYNGYSSSTGNFSNLVSRGDGNGFKIGGYGLGGTPYFTILSNYSPIPTNTVQFCVSAGNKQSGFYANHHLEGNNWYNNSAYLNKRNYNMSNAQSLSSSGISITGPGWNHVLTNNVGLGATLVELTNIDIPECTLTNNYFDPNTALTVTPSDFLSLDINLLTSPRQADGSLPDTDFMKLEANSDLVDAGADIGFPFNGSAPDLGYTDYLAALSTAEIDTSTVSDFKNYPNPFTSETRVNFNLETSTKIEVTIYNLMGVKVFELPKQSYNSGENFITLKRNNLSSGSYLLTLRGEDGSFNTKIIIAK